VVLYPLLDMLEVTPSFDQRWHDHRQAARTHK
jgi:hypothetical protein